MNKVTVVGAGLAGCEAAQKLSSLGYSVTLVEMKPKRMSKAHSSNNFAELVCSNSLKAMRLESAAGLLKHEMKMMGSLVVEAAEKTAVSAGGALAVDREAFSSYITEKIKGDKNINVVSKLYEKIDRENPIIVATGPLTEGALAEDISDLTGGFLSFFDAAAPIISAQSIDMENVHAASRYGRGGDDYLNCYFNKQNYEDFWNELVGARVANLHDVDKDYKVYEGCMPVEKLAKRGIDTIRFGPLKPVGLVDPKTDRRPWAAVQLRREDEKGTMFNIVGFQTNLVFSEQKRVFSMIPGLENAEFIRYGVMHRNSFINSPEVLNITQNLKSTPNVFFAGQITGVEGYCESAASGLLSAIFLDRMLKQKPVIIPSEKTMCGSLLRYINTKNKNFQPMGANMGIVAEIGERIKDKKLKYEKISQRAIDDMKIFLEGLT